MPKWLHVMQWILRLLPAPAHSSISKAAVSIWQEQAAPVPPSEARPTAPTSNSQAPQAATPQIWLHKTRLFPRHPARVYACIPQIRLRVPQLPALPSDTRATLKTRRALKLRAAEVS